MTDWDDRFAPGAVLRTLVAEAAGVREAAEIGEAAGIERGHAGALDADLAERGDDPEPVARLPELVGPSDTVVGVIPRADPDLARRLLDDGDRGDDRTVRLVFTGQAADRLTGPAGAVVRSVLTEHGVDAVRHDGDSPVGVLLVDDRAVAGLFDDRGLAALLWSDAAAVREWAAETCQRYLSAAGPV